MKKYVGISLLAAALVVLIVFSRGLISPSVQRPEVQPIIERTAMVLYVVDGDTISLEGEEKVRLVGIDTPELNSSDADERVLAEKAKEFVESFCQPETEVGLNVDDLEPTDRYGRTLAVVYVKIENEWINLNARLLTLGLAEVLFIPPSEFNPYEWVS